MPRPHPPSIVMALAALAPSVAAAEPTLPEAQALIAEAARQFKAGQSAEALQSYTEAARHPTAARDPRLQWNIARCHEELGQYALAIEGFERAAALSEDDRRRARAEARAARVRAERFGRIEVDCAEGEARIEALGEPRSCPAAWPQVEVGDYPATLRTLDGRVARFVVTVTPSETTVARPALPAPGVIEPAPVEPAATSWWPLAAAGLSGASAIAAAWLYSEGSHAADAARTASTPRAYDRAVARKDTFESGYYATLGVSGALVITATVLYLVDGGSADTLEPAADSSTAGWGWTW